MKGAAIIFVKDEEIKEKLEVTRKELSSLKHQIGSLVERVELIVRDIFRDSESGTSPRMREFPIAKDSDALYIFDDSGSLSVIQKSDFSKSGAYNAMVFSEKVHVFNTEEVEALFQKFKRNIEEVKRELEGSQ